MSRLKIQTRLYLVMAFLLSVTLSVGAVSFYSSRRATSRYQNLTGTIIPKAEKLHALIEEFLRIRMNLRNLGLPGISPSDAAESLKVAENSIETIKILEKEYEALGFVPGQRELYEVQQKAWQDFYAVGGRVMGHFKEGTEEGRQEMTKIFFGECPKAAASLLAKTEELIEFHQKNIAKGASEAQNITNTGNNINIAVMIGGILLGTILGFFFTRSLTNTLEKITVGISSAGEATAVSAEQLSDASGRLSEASTEAAASLEETVASLEELSSMVKLNSDHAQEANGLSQKSRGSAEIGETEIRRLISAMTEIANGSKKIEEIIKTIDDIAFQTNLLALNASVEAARAGEQGKGFAVVAEAVRSLAQRSAAAAKDISTLIKDNVEKSERGSEIAKVSNQVLSDILQSIKKVAELNSEIASGSQEQSKGLQQISQAMNQLDQTTQGNAVSSSQIAHSAHAMIEQSEELGELVTDLKALIEGPQALVLNTQKEASNQKEKHRKGHGRHAEFSLAEKKQAS